MRGTEAFIEEHVDMVRGLAVRLRAELSLHGELEDLVAFGFGGLLEAHQRFDPGRGVRFQTFAYHRVRGAMLDGVRKMARLSRRAHERAREADACSPTACPRPPVPLETVFARVSAGLTTAGPLHSHPSGSPEQVLLQHESVTRLLSAMAQLPERQRLVVRAHYFDCRSLEDIAAELGISRSWASRLHTGALRSLRAALDG